MREFIERKRRTTFRKIPHGKYLYRLDWFGAVLGLDEPSFEASFLFSFKKRKEKME